MIHNELDLTMAPVIQEMLDHSPSLIAMVGHDLVFQYANVPFVQHWSQSGDPVVGRSLREVVGEDYFERLIEPVVQAISGRTFRFEAQCDRDGYVLTFDTKLIPFKSDRTGENAGFFVFSNKLDVPVEQATTFPHFLDNTPGRVYLIDRSYRIQYANQRVHEAFQAESNLSGTLMPDLLGPEIWVKAKTQIDLALAGKHVSFREYLDTPTFPDRCISVYVTPNQSAETGEIEGVYCLVVDETELEKTKTKLRRTQRNFELALNSQMVGIWEVDLQREDWLFTEHIERLLGLQTGELENSIEKALQRVHPDDLPSITEKRFSKLKSGEHDIQEFRCQTNSGEYRWFRTVGNAELNDQGQPIFLAGTIADINELKSAEIIAASRLESQNAFLSMLSHELRNPVAAIQYAVDAIGQSESINQQLAAPQKKLIDIIKRQSVVVSRLLTDLLNVSRVSQDQISFEKSDVAISKLLEEVVSASQPFVQKKKQQLDYQCESPNLIVDGDRVRLIQAFTNLAHNASKYSPAGALITIKCDSIDGQCLVTVADQGVGIDAEALDRIFELFYQEDRSLSRTDGGLGVGLFLVKKIIDAHGGSIIARSPGGLGGSDFEVSLPLRETAASSRSNFATHGPDSGPKLVIVEDNEDSRAALELALAGRGFEVVGLPDGETAVETIPAIKPSVVLLDIGLPGIDGLEVMRQLKSHPGLQKTVFVALTGYGQQHEKQMIFDAGFDDHVVKPIDIESLCQSIDARIR